MTASTDAAELLTVPQTAIRLKIPLDRLRKAIRKSAGAQALFEVLGPTRVIRAGKLEDLRRAISEK
jgi:hypothetical protein